MQNVSPGPTDSNLPVCRGEGGSVSRFLLQHHLIELLSYPAAILQQAELFFRGVANDAHFKVGGQIQWGFGHPMGYLVPVNQAAAPGRGHGRAASGQTSGWAGAAVRRCFSTSASI